MVLILTESMKILYKYTSVGWYRSLGDAEHIVEGHIRRWFRQNSLPVCKNARIATRTRIWSEKTYFGKRWKFTIELAYTGLSKEFLKRAVTRGTCCAKKTPQTKTYRRRRSR